jgi:hypothetical protein
VRAAAGGRRWVATQWKPWGKSITASASAAPPATGTPLGQHTQEDVWFLYRPIWKGLCHVCHDAADLGLACGQDPGGGVVCCGWGQAVSPLLRRGSHPPQVSRRADKQGYVQPSCPLVHKPAALLNCRKSPRAEIIAPCNLLRCSVCRGRLPVEGNSIIFYRHPFFPEER